MHNFLKVVEKAKESCKNAKNDIVGHFADVSKMVEIGSEGYRKMVFV
jgi:DNA-damage-inducible protein D